MLTIIITAKNWHNNNENYEILLQQCQTKREKQIIQNEYKPKFVTVQTSNTFIIICKLVCADQFIKIM